MPPRQDKSSEMLLVRFTTRGWNTGFMLHSTLLSSSVHLHLCRYCTSITLCPLCSVYLHQKVTQLHHLSESETVKSDGFSTF